MFGPSGAAERQREASILPLTKQDEVEAAVFRKSSSAASQAQCSNGRNDFLHLSDSRVRSFIVNRL